LGLAGLLLVLSRHDPAASGLFPPCPFRAATAGLRCPGCGTLRGLHALLHGEVRRAFTLNPLMVLSLPFLGYLGVAALWTRRRGPAPAWARPRHLAWFVLAVLCAWWLGRNLL
jgi:hypothetical protein